MIMCINGNYHKQTMNEDAPHGFHFLYSFSFSNARFIKNRSLFTDVIQVVTITKEIFVQGQIADDLSLALKIYIPTLTKYFVILKVMKYFWSVN